MPNPLTEALSKMSEEQIANLYKTTFSSPDAKLCLQDIMNRAYRDSPVCIDAVSRMLVGRDQLYLNSGMQLIALHIEGQINFEPQPKEENDND